MLTDNVLQRLQRLMNLLPVMDQAQREAFLKLIRDLKAAEGEGVMPSSAVQAMADAVPDDLMKRIVADLRKPQECRCGGQSGPSFHRQMIPETVHSPTTLMGDWNIVGLATGIFVRRWWPRVGHFLSIGEPTRS
jgi:hypothetical protein